MNERLHSLINTFNQIPNKDNSKRIIIATLKPAAERDNRPNNPTVTT